MKNVFKKKRHFTLFISLYAIFHIVLADPGVAMERLYAHIGARDGLQVLDPDGNVVFSRNADLPLVPASTVKIVSAMAALDILGPDFRFKTEVYLTAENDLVLKGYGDPLLVSEVLTDLAEKSFRALAPQKTFRSLVVDDAFVDATLTVPGRSTTDNPYDAPNGALCANFNTVSFETGKNGLQSAEPQTPLIPYALDRIRKSGSRAGRVVFSHNRHEAALYAGHLFQYFLNQRGISFSRKIRHGRVDGARHRRVVSYLSPYALSEVLAKLLQYSNNFIANQVLLVLGAQTTGGVASLDKGVKALQGYIDRQIGPGRAKIVEGSGLSRGNRVRAADLCRCLAKFFPYRTLLQSEGRQSYKTGTLDGVRARAGYIQGKDGRFYRFAVLLNTPGKTVDPIMNELLSRLP